MELSPSHVHVHTSVRVILEDIGHLLSVVDYLSLPLNSLELTRLGWLQAQRVHLFSLPLIWNCE